MKYKILDKTDKNKVYASDADTLLLSILFSILYSSSFIEYEYHKKNQASYGWHE